MDSIRVCFVCNEYPPGRHGGIGVFVQTIARALVDQGHQARVIGVYRPEYDAPDYQEDHGVQVWRLREPTARFGWIVGRVRMFRQISKWARSGEIDLVEIADYAGPAALWPSLPVPVVARLHGSATYFADELGGRVSSRLYQIERASLKRSDFICSVSHYTADRTRELFRLPRCPDDVLYNFVESPDDGPATVVRQGSSVIYSGTLAYKKGVVSLFDAWPQVLESHREAKLHVYGKDGRTNDGSSMTEMLQSQLSERQRETVTFHGHAARKEVLDALRHARLGVFPSYAESFGLAPAESMAAACPTIYSERGCGSELVRDGEDGLLIDPDRPESIAEAIIRLLDDDGLADQLGAAGQDRIQENFSPEAVMPRNIRFYRNCIERKNGG